GHAADVGSSSRDALDTGGTQAIDDAGPAGASPTHIDGLTIEAQVSGSGQFGIIKDQLATHAHPVHDVIRHRRFTIPDDVHRTTGGTLGEGRNRRYKKQRDGEKSEETRTNACRA